MFRLGSGKIIIIKTKINKISYFQLKTLHYNKINIILGFQKINIKLIGTEL